MKPTTSDDIEFWLDAINNIHLKDNCPAPFFMKPFHLATFAYLLRHHGATDLSVPPKIQSYANSMNLWGASGLPAPKEIKRNPGRYFPLEILRARTQVEDIANALTRLISEACKDADTNDAICTMLRELIDNCFSHSEAEGGIAGMLCAQVWNGGRRAQISIADSGIGIRESLARSEEYFGRLKLENACEMATEFGVTSKRGKGHSGYGLSVARKLLEQNYGVLYVHSQYEAFILSAGHVRSFKSEAPWKGTLLVIEFNLDNPMNIGEVYRSFPLPDGMSDDDFNF